MTSTKNKEALKLKIVNFKFLFYDFDYFVECSRKVKKEHHATPTNYVKFPELDTGQNGRLSVKLKLM